MITKQKAIETVRDLLRSRDHDPFWTNEMKEGYRHACREITEALDRAGAFPDADALAEIERAARDAFDLERGNHAWRFSYPGEIDAWRAIAIRLATACRKAGHLKNPTR